MNKLPNIASLGDSKPELGLALFVEQINLN